MEDKIKIMFVFEMMGRPPEHIRKTLGEFVKKIGEQKGIKIISKKIHKPKPVEKEGAQNLFTTFAEVEMVLDNLNLVFDVVFNMLPAHAEVIEPKELSLKSFDLSSVLSGLAIRLHRYDEIAKVLVLEKNALVNKLKEMQEKIENLEEGIKSGKNKKKK